MGVVQRSFEKIVESLVGASLALEDFIKSDVNAPSGVVYAEPVTMSNHFDLALSRIITAFYPYMGGFSFSTVYAQRLRRYAGYSQ
jgi:hypothetical protein